MDKRDEMVKKLANMIYHSFDTFEEALKVAEYLVDNGVRTASGFRVEVTGEGPYSNPDYDVVPIKYSEVDNEDI